VPIRIYALAKELKVDSKHLVDICTKAGVTGKGSALASLDDDEVVKVKNFLSSGKGRGGRAKLSGTSPAAPLSPATVFTREDYVAPGGSVGVKPRVLVSKPKKKEDEPKGKPEDEVRRPEDEVRRPEDEVRRPEDEVRRPEDEVRRPEDEVRRPEDEVRGKPEDEPKGKPEDEAKGKPTRAEPAPEAPEEATPPQLAPAKGEPPRTVLRRPEPPKDEPLPPERPPSEPDKGESKHPDGGGPKPPVKKDPVIKLAAMPAAKQPKPAPKSEEPAPQKPIMTLPKDAIRGAIAGSKAPLEQFTKHHEKKRKASDARKSGAGKGGARAAQGVEPVADTPAGKPSSRDRRRAKSDEDAPAKGLAGMAGSRAARQQSRRARRDTARPAIEGDMDRPARMRRGRRTRKGITNTAAPRKEKVVLRLPCSVRAFSEMAGVPVVQILQALMQLGTMATINAEIDHETAELLAAELNLDVELKQQESLEESLLADIRGAQDDPQNLKPRPPVITFLGHVDHGKTSLLDRIICTDVVSGEAGGITQHIRAYTIEKDGRRISFVDTPGHEAFTEMRARGTNVTDIAVLVVAAEDGVMPQTEEAISHARAAEVPIVVAMNKIDLPGADPDKVFRQLSEHNLLPVEWGGDVEVIKTSAVTGEGIDALLETLLLTADLHEYKANPQRAAYGTCLEAQQEGGRGVVSKLIVQNGTLRVGDVIVCGAAHGRIKAMYDTLKPRVKVREAGPSVPVNVMGLDVAPDAGEAFYVLDDIARAREIAANRETLHRRTTLAGQTASISFEEFQRRLEEGRLGEDDEVVTLNLILRADVRGSIEAIMKELDKLDHPEVQIKILQATVGGITAADVTLAHASDAVIVGFNVIPDEAARAMVEQRGVEIRRYDVIYKLTDDIRAMLEGKLKPEERATDLGRALVQQLFNISRVGVVAGCRVLGGVIERGCRIRVNRDGRGIGDYPLESLRREKDDTKDVREGLECGMKLAGFDDLKEGDILEAYKIEEVARTLEQTAGGQ